ncbi:MAG: 1,2-phenylacetyl-CoA epoxidase subunit PaaC [Burkholderiaceae bacterium]|nr:1,2-phenylacetyl-CoA epoxidase subunit PaaC [Burkholderiaceae bacterium]
MQASITLSADPELRFKLHYILRLADTCLILAQRLGEWCGHAPALEEDIALTNIALDLVGQSRLLYTHAGLLSGHTEDQLAFLRDERDYVNLTLVELPNGIRKGQPNDFAFSILRVFAVASFLKPIWQRLQLSNDAELAAIAGKALKESRYHQQHAGDWVVRLGDGTDESHRRMQDALNQLWPYTTEMLSNDAVDEAAHDTGLGPRFGDVKTDWLADVNAVLTAATLQAPQPSAFLSTGKVGRHSEHMGFLLTDMQYLQRSFPGGVW